MRVLLLFATVPSTIATMCAGYGAWPEFAEWYASQLSTMMNTMSSSPVAISTHSLTTTLALLSISLLLGGCGGEKK